MNIKIGILAEGKADQFVLRNILYALGFEKNQIKLLRPELDQDESQTKSTKFNNQDGGNKNNENIKNNESNEREFGSWTNVKKDCESGEPFMDFLDNQLDEQKYIIVQLDTDTCSQYGVQEVFNPKTHEDFGVIRQRVIDKINEWLKNEYSENLFYAICIRQMDAWVLTLYANKNDKDTGLISSPKNILGSLKAYQDVKSYKQIGLRYEKLSINFSNHKKLNQALEYNQSLKDFVASIKTAFSN
jgi:hypothetical protein